MDTKQTLTKDELYYVKDLLRDRKATLTQKLFIDIENKKSIENAKVHYDDIERELRLAKEVYDKL